MCVSFEIIRLLDAAIFDEQIPSELLTIFGWTKFQYENELLKRIDEEFLEFDTTCHSN